MTTHEEVMWNGLSPEVRAMVRAQQAAAAAERQRAFDAQLAELQHQLAIEKAVNTRLAAVTALPADGGDAPRAARPPQPRLHESASYDGSSMMIDAWLADMRKLADFYGVEDGPAPGTYAATHLKGAALTWWQMSVPAPKPATWDNFV